MPDLFHFFSKGSSTPILCRPITSNLLWQLTTSTWSQPALTWDGRVAIGLACPFVPVASIAAKMGQVGVPWCTG